MIGKKLDSNENLVDNQSLLYLDSTVGTEKTPVQANPSVARWSVFQWHL